VNALGHLAANAAKHAAPEAEKAGTTHGNPHDSGEAPGHSGDAPGHSGDAPGHSGEHGNPHAG
jgi:hypothetical protein